MCFDAWRLVTECAMDLFAQRRLAAHTQSAIGHERSAEFHGAVSDFFRSRGDDAQATRARRLAEDHRRSALRERIHAMQIGRPNAMVLADRSSLADDKNV